MCYSASISVASFSISVILSLILLVTYSKVLGLFFVYIALMQLYDFIFWTFPYKHPMNYWVTKLAMITNNLQPIVLALLIIYVGKQKLTHINIILLLVYGVVAAIYTIYAMTKTSFTLPTKACNGGLYWEWSSLPGYLIVYSLYLALLMSLFYDHFPKPMNYILILITIVSFGLSGLFYWKHNMTGRMWCWIGAFTPLFLIIAFYYLRMKSI